MTNRTPRFMGTPSHHQHTHTPSNTQTMSPTTTSIMASPTDSTTTSLETTINGPQNPLLTRPAAGCANASRRPQSRRKRRKRVAEGSLPPQHPSEPTPENATCHWTQPAADASRAATATPAASTTTEPPHNLLTNCWSAGSLVRELSDSAARFLPQLLHTLTNRCHSAAAATSKSATTSCSLGYMTYLLLVLCAATTCCLAQPPCETSSWWDPMRDKCIPCTVCQDEMIPLRPCQQHRDTICGSIYDLKIDWVVLAKTEPNWKERRKSDDIEHLDQLQLQQQHLTHEQIQQLQEEGLPLDWQTGALFVAVLACLLFFIVAACILVHHMRQWRRMERRLDQDVEELSTKLMAKLVEVQSLEGGTFFIGNADALRVPSSAAMSSMSAGAAASAAGAPATQSSMFHTQYVLLPEKPSKHHDRRIIKNQQPGNVYIEESSSKG